MDIPRRNRIDLWITAERKIQDAIDEVENIGADTLLTEAVSLLSKARERVADFVDRC